MILGSSYIPLIPLLQGGGPPNLVVDFHPVRLYTSEMLVEASQTLALCAEHEGAAAQRPTSSDLGTADRVVFLNRGMPV